MRTENTCKNPKSQLKILKIPKCQLKQPAGHLKSLKEPQNQLENLQRSKMRTEHNCKTPKPQNPKTPCDKILKSKNEI